MKTLTSSKIFIATLLTFFSIISQGFGQQGGGSKGLNPTGIYVEPFISFESGRVEGPNIEDGKINLFQFGGIGGYSVYNAMIGIDFSLGTGNYVTQKKKSYDFVISEFGLATSYRFNFGLFLYYTYLMTVDATVIPANTRRELEGSGHKIGVGYLLNKTRINFQIKTFTWEAITLENQPRTELTAESSSIVSVNFSWPFVL